MDILQRLVKNDQVNAYCIREYFGAKVIAFTTENSQKHYSRCPWGFAIEHKGELRNFYGMPNRVETKAKALKRGWYRAKWLHDGTWDEHYRS